MQILCSRGQRYSYKEESYEGEKEEAAAGAAEPAERRGGAGGNHRLHPDPLQPVLARGTDRLILDQDSFTNIISQPIFHTTFHRRQINDVVVG